MHMRPRIDAAEPDDVIHEAVQNFADEHGLKQSRAWAELVKLGLTNAHEYTRSPPEPQGGEPVKTHDGWEEQ